MDRRTTKPLSMCIPGPEHLRERMSAEVLVWTVGKVCQMFTDWLTDFYCLEIGHKLVVHFGLCSSAVHHLENPCTDLLSNTGCFVSNCQLVSFEHCTNFPLMPEPQHLQVCNKDFRSNTPDKSCV